MAENTWRQNPDRLKEPILALNIDQDEGEPIIGWDGEFNMLLDTYSSDVNLQIRVPAIKDDEGNQIRAAGAWKTYATFDSLYNDTFKVCSNWEYRFTTDTAGSRVLLGVQWEGVS